MSKNQDSWIKIFEKYNVLDKIHKEGKFYISSSKINEFREARLMSKFDTEEQLPDIFVKNKLSILPTKRGEYIISDFKAFQEIDPQDITLTKYMETPEHITTLDINDRFTEALAINYCYISGMLSDFVGEADLSPTVSGRMGSGKFDFKINRVNGEKLLICVENAQIEIDAGFEGLKNFVIIEAKNNLFNNFLIRQLYYPMRAWKSKTIKNIKLIYLVYSNGIFYLREYSYSDEKEYNYISLIKAASYSTKKTEIDIDFVTKIAYSEKYTTSDKKIPFPQANSFDRIINLIEILSETNKPVAKSEITEKIIKLSVRQTYYYVGSCQFLGLVEIKNKKVHLTQKGLSITNLPLAERNMEYVKCILEHKIFSDCMKQYLEKSEINLNMILDIINTNPQFCNLNRDKKISTSRRRASTIKGWLDWILNLTRF